MKPSLAIRRLLLASALLATTITVHAQLYWDTNGPTAGFGSASGTWGTDSFWNDDPTGGAGTFSTTTSTSDSLNFGTATDGLATGTISVSGTVDSGNITFGSASGAITLDGGTINFANTATITVNNVTNTIGSDITGAATSLTIDGTGTLVLTGTNTYTGDTIVNAGTLSMASNVIQDSSNIFIAGGATLAHTANDNFTLANGQNLIGTGTGTATYNNTANVSNRSIIAPGNNTIGHTGIGTLKLQRFQVQGTGVTMTGGNVESGLGTGTGLSYRGLVVGNSTPGDFTITGGTLTTLGTGNAADIIGIGSTTGTLNINGGSYLSNKLDIGFGDSPTFPGGTLNIDSGSATIGTFVYNFSNAAGSEGIVNLSGGTLTLGGITSSNGANRIFKFNGGQFVASGNVNFATTVATGVGDGGANINTNGNTVTVSGALTDNGSGGLTKSGAGTLILSGTNTYVGATSVNAGVLRINNTGALNGTSQINLGTTTGTTLAINVNNLNITTPIYTANAGQTSTINNVFNPGVNTTPVIADIGKISGAGNIMFTNTGPGVPSSVSYFYNLNAASDYEGNTILDSITHSNTTISLGLANALPTTTVLGFGSTAGVGSGRSTNLNLNGFSQELSGLEAAGANLRVIRVHNTSADAAILTINDDSNRTYRGVLGTTGLSNTATGNNFGVVKEGTGTWTLALSNLTALVNSYDGGTILNEGGITLGNGATLGTGPLQINNPNTGEGTDVILTLPSGSDLTVGSLSGSIATPASGINYTTIQTQFGRTFTVNQTEDGNFAGDILGGGNFVLGGDSTHTLVLSGTNFYSGDTTVSAGTLSLANPNPNNDDATVTIASEATLHLDFNGTDTVDKLFIGNTQMPAGVYGPSATNLTQITGTGTLTVISDPEGGYTAWAAINAPLTGGNPAADEDGDGVANAIEYVLGGTIATNDIDKLPGVSTSGGNLIFTFERDQASIDGTTSVAIEVGTDLAAWPVTYTVGADTAGSSAGVVVTKDSPVAGFDTVTLTVAQGSDPKKFARLKVEVE